MSLKQRVLAGNELVALHVEINFENGMFLERAGI